MSDHRDPRDHSQDADGNPLSRTDLRWRAMKAVLEALDETPGMPWPSLGTVRNWERGSTHHFAEAYAFLLRFLEERDAKLGKLVEVPGVDRGALGVHRCEGCERTLLELAEGGHGMGCHWGDEQRDARKHTGGTP